MGLRRWLGWVASAPTAELSASEPSAVFSVDLVTPVDDYIQGQQVDLNLEAPVTREKALTVDAVIRGRNLLCSFAALPMVTRDAKGKVIESKLLNQIDPNTPNVITIAGTVDDLIFEGYAWWRATDWDASGFPISCEKLDARTVTMTPPADRAKGLRTLPSEQKLPLGTVWVEGVQTPIRDALGRPIMIRFDSPNPGLLKSGARSIRRLLLLETAGARYADNPRPQDYFTPEDGADTLGDTEIEEVLTAWKLARKKRTTAYVPAAMKYNTVDAPTPVELQIIEQQRKAEIGIANRMGLDPEDLGISTTTRTYQNGVDRRQDRVNDVYAPYMEAITQRLSMNDISRRGHVVVFDLNNYLKPDPKTRWENHKTAVEIGAMSIAEVRDVEDLDPNPELERQARQKAAQPVVTAPDELARRRTSVSASRPGSVAFSRGDEDDETSATLTFAVDDETRAEFSTDLEQRTITGLMLPWNKASRDSRSYSLWRFKKDSLSWSDPSRVKLNLDHKRTDVVAYAQKIWSTPKGLMATFKVTRAAVGDEALILAEDKVKDGFSVEVDFPGGAAGWALNEDGDDLVRDVHSGQLTGCALTAAPSFDDARLTSVRASRNREDGPMPEEKKPSEGGTLTLSADASAEFGRVVSAALDAAGEKNAEQMTAFTDAVQALVDAQQKPGEVNPAGARFQVNEAPTYRFDGSRGEFDFSTDIIAGAKNNDAEAMARVQSFMKNDFAKARAEFAVTTSNVASLNPSINRPDMYVDQLQYPTPLWNAIRKGTISDNTPFVLPKFNTSSGLVADHVQGTEPTPGALTTTSQTITPTAVSGKVEVTREAWDQGGNPQLSTILWRQMVRAYDEALEQGAATLFAGITPGGTVTLTAGGADAALAAEVKSALAALHFIRGGFRFQDFELESGLYRALAEAVDDTGRPLFPVIGAQNADGQMGNLFGALSLAGLAGRPAWALAYTAGAANKSYLFNREDVHGWASAPQRLDFEYRVAFVDVAIWGYKAFACTRPDGVRAFVYDETA